MQNIGEEICGEYLKHIKNCEFITYNVTNPDIQGELDVVGINLKGRTIYICEVAIHTQGLQYVKNGKQDDYSRFISKFDKDIKYAKKYFSSYTIIPMLWSSIVRISNEKAKYNTYEELQRVKKYIIDKHKLNLELIINEKFLSCFEELKRHAGTKTSEFKSSVMRMFQIENSLKKYVKLLDGKK